MSRSIEPHILFVKRPMKNIKFFPDSNYCCCPVFNVVKNRGFQQCTITSYISHHKAICD